MNTQRSKRKPTDPRLREIIKAWPRATEPQRLAALNTAIRAKRRSEKEAAKKDQERRDRFNRAFPHLNDAERAAIGALAERAGKRRDDFRKAVVKDAWPLLSEAQRDEFAGLAQQRRAARTKRQGGTR